MFTKEEYQNIVKMNKRRLIDRTSTIILGQIERTIIAGNLTPFYFQKKEYDERISICDWEEICSRIEENLKPLGWQIIIHADKKECSIAVY